MRTEGMILVQPHRDQRPGRRSAPDPRTPERANIQRLLEKAFGTGLTAADSRAGPDLRRPFVRGLSGGEALNLAYRQGEVAARGTAIVNAATHGTGPNDLSNLLRLAGSLVRSTNRRDLKAGVTNFATFTGGPSRPSPRTSA